MLYEKIKIKVNILVARKNSYYYIHGTLNLYWFKVFLFLILTRYENKVENNCSNTKKSE